MKRLIACLLFVCLVFAMTACQQPATQISTEPTTETAEAKTVLTWNVKSISGRFSGDTSQTLLHIMDYDATIEAVNTLWGKLSYPDFQKNLLTSGARCVIIITLKIFWL